MTTASIQRRGMTGNISREIEEVSKRRGEES
jgi:hypothetical protein